VSLFLELEEELGLFRKVTLRSLCAGNSRGVAADGDAEFA